jgi:Tfp pilus assembly protein PilF
MSLINQMLRDLDEQRGPASGAQVAALRGLGLVGNRQVQDQRILPVFGGALVIAMAVALGYWIAGKLTSGQVAVVTEAPVKAPVIIAPELTHSAQLETRSQEAAITTVGDELQASHIDESQPSTVAAAPAARQETPVPPPQGAIASIEVKPVIEAAIHAPATPSPARIITLNPQQKADRLYNQAQQALARHRTEAASNLLEQALTEHPQHAAAREQLAILMIKDNQSARAEALLAEGLALSPGRIELAHAYAQLLVERGALQPALESLQHLAGIQAAGAETLALQAGIMTRLQRYTDAAENYRRALRLQPRQAVWWTGLGVALEHDGLSVSALDAYRRAAQLPLQTEVKHFVQQRIQALSGLSAGPQG